MQQNTSKKLRFGCGASLNSQLTPGRHYSGKVKQDSPAKTDKDSQRTVTRQKTGYKQE